MICILSVIERSRLSGVQLLLRLAAAGHRPDRDHHAVAHDVIPVVQVDGCASMIGHDLDPVAQAQRRAIPPPQMTVFFRQAHQLPAWRIQHQRQAKVTGQGFQAGIALDAVGIRRAR